MIVGRSNSLSLRRKIVFLIESLFFCDSRSAGSGFLVDFWSIRPLTWFFFLGESSNVRLMYDVMYTVMYGNPTITTGRGRVYHYSACISGVSRRGKPLCMEEDSVTK